jgi:Ca-activated chloride channel family protein
VAEFGLLLRDSKYKGHATFSGALQRARKAAAHDPHGYRAELCRLIEKAWSLKEPLAAKK